MSERAARRARRKQAQEENRCTATTRKGTRCTRPPVPGRSTCGGRGGHGGDGGRPITKGVHSAALKGDLLARYESLRERPDLMSMTEGIAVMTALCHRIAQRLQDGDTPEFRSRLSAKVDVMIAARGEPGGEAGKHFQELVTMIRAAQSDTETETALWDRMERLQKRVEQSTKALHARSTSLPLEKLAEVLLLLSNIMAEKVGGEVAAEVRKMWLSRLGSMDELRGLDSGVLRN